VVVFGPQDNCASVLKLEVGQH